MRQKKNKPLDFDDDTDLDDDERSPRREPREWLRQVGYELDLHDEDFQRGLDDDGE